VTELNEERASLAIAQAVVRLGQVLDLDTVAEGIETPEQARAMLDLGYDHGQGYHFARPLTAEDVPAFLARVNSLDQAGLHPIGR
jgi:EAL domain-containing protein (putative c-di-GMP-specific phosphodiesterase class I)